MFTELKLVDNQDDALHGAQMMRFCYALKCCSFSKNCSRIQKQTVHLGAAFSPASSIVAAPWQEMHDVLIAYTVAND